MGNTSEKNSSGPWHEGLSDTERVLVEEYAKDFNQTRAVLRTPGLTDNYDSARSEGYRYFTKVHIRKAVELLLNERCMGTDEALSRLAHMARADIGDYLAIDENTGGARLDMSGGHPTYPIKKVKTKRRRETRKDGQEWEIEYTEIELHDPKDALDKILRAAGAYRDGVQVTQVSINSEDLTDEQKASAVAEYFKHRG